MLPTIQSTRGPALSVTIHSAALALLLLASANSNVQQAVKATFGHVRVIEPYSPDIHVGKGGGGGGDRSLLPASPGQLPRVALHQFTPPAAVIHNDQPKLPTEPTIIASVDIGAPHSELLVLSDPWAKNGPLSNGTGRNGGIGDGDGTGVGPGKGPRAGPGEDGQTGGGARGLFGAFTAPVVLYTIEPEFSEDARKAKLQGVVMLYAEVDTTGRLRNIRVTRGLGLGLEEKAIDAVKRWRFRPAMRNGKPVAAPAQIEVNFHLL